MFTGIIHATGRIVSTKKINRERRITIETDSGIVRGVLEGDSIAIDGVCLTALMRSAAHGVARESARRRILSAATPDTLLFDLMDSTLKLTTLGMLKVGDFVNIETAIRASDFVGGHFVSGHVDGVGILRKVMMRGQARHVVIALPRDLMAYVIPQGSIAVNGVSLTVVAVTHETFSVALTPYTATHTNLGALKAGDRVNIETDMFAKYILKFLNHYGPYQKVSHRRGKV